MIPLGPLGNVSFRPAPGFPLGAHVEDGGVSFRVVSHHATQVWLELFDEADGSAAARVPLARRGDLWSAHVAGLAAGQLYGLRAEGPWDTRAGHHFDPTKLLIDPYAAALSGQTWDLSPSRGDAPVGPGPGPNGGSGVPKCVVVADDFDWQGDAPPQVPWSATVIYEVHVRGFTRHPSSDVVSTAGATPGTFGALVEKIPHLVSLGITAVELLPIHAFDPRENPAVRHPQTGEVLGNYWGYSPLAFFAPAPHYGSTPQDPRAVVRELKAMVRALHAAGIEVILDVVFNHTGEGDLRGPTVSLRGLDNRRYYLRGVDGYLDATGCGNTVRANHPVVTDLIVDCLRHWVTEYHVDGFRFDLATALTRGDAGTLRDDSPLIARLGADPLLRQCKLIAEPWDAAGGFQLGRFPGASFSEWNSHFRDDVRGFWRGEPYRTPRLATRLAGSSDLYDRPGRSPTSSINFITAHDGFTLADLVSYERKHNTANGEDNRDGSDHNLSWNCGVEGPSDDPEVRAVRARQQRNLLATLLLSEGVPMLVAGDEFGRTQGGNNNPYNQDNETSWVDWALAQHNADLLRFTRGLIRLRRGHDSLGRTRFFTGEAGPGGHPDLRWYGPEGGDPNWSGPEATLACVMSGTPDLFLAFNAEATPQPYRLPRLRAAGARWSRLIDTARPPPDDIHPLEAPAPLPADRRREGAYVLAPHSMVVLVAQTG